MNFNKRKTQMFKTPCGTETNREMNRQSEIEQREGLERCVFVYVCVQS